MSHMPRDGKLFRAGVLATLVAGVLAGCGHHNNDYSGYDSRGHADYSGYDSRRHGGMMMPGAASDGEFAAMMAMHHQQAIDMATAEANHGGREDVRDLARTIVDDQTREVATLRNIAREEGRGEGMGNGMGEGMGGPMMHHHPGGPMDSMRGTQGAEMDQMFLRQMIGHHSQGVEMARGAMPNLRREDLRNIARGVVENQSREMERMRGMLGQQGTSYHGGAAGRDADNRRDDSMNHQMASGDMLACMKECGECASVCAQCATHCLHMGGEHASPEHQGIMQDCAEICGVAACFMARGSPHAGHVCRECAEICSRCAESCEKMGMGDAMMRRCAEVCRGCAKSCERMAGAGM